MVGNRLSCAGWDAHTLTPRGHTAVSDFGLDRSASTRFATQSRPGSWLTQRGCHAWAMSKYREWAGRNSIAPTTLNRKPSMRPWRLYSTGDRPKHSVRTAGLCHRCDGLYRSRGHLAPNRGQLAVSLGHVPNLHNSSGTSLSSIPWLVAMNRRPSINVDERLSHFYDCREVA